MNKKIKTEAVDHLFEAILTLKNSEECYSFFEDVCTVNELLSLSQRYEVAKMLREKDLFGNCRKNGSLDCDDQQGKPFFELRKRWIRYGVWAAAKGTGAGGTIIK